MTTIKLTLKPKAQLEPIVHLQLRHKDGRTVSIGDEVTDFRGEKATVTGWQVPAHPGSTGRVHVEIETPTAKYQQGYYPSVYDLEWFAS